VLYPKRAEHFSVAAINYATALTAGRTRAMNGTPESFLFSFFNSSEVLAARLATGFRVSEILLFLLNIPSFRRDSWIPLRRRGNFLLKRVVGIIMQNFQKTNNSEQRVAERCTRRSSCRNLPVGWGAVEIIRPSPCGVGVRGLLHRSHDPGSRFLETREFSLRVQGSQRVPKSAFRWFPLPKSSPACPPADL